jgi:4-amino-4-deoxy-L-arabinose transferase-like glycosyltransferase
VTQNLLRARPSGWGLVPWVLAALAIVLRLAMFAGRGDYVAFDEGWYLLLGRNLLAGDGFSLSGLRHSALSPLFPLLAGSVDRVIGDAVWSGRIVAATAAGLLVIPCWSIFNRMAGRRTAVLASVVVISLPGLAAFVVPYWIRRDLWVGAEPLLNLFLFSAIALVLRGRQTRRTFDWLAAGACFALAYLARPEAILVLGIVGLLIGVGATIRREVEQLSRAAVMALAFCIVVTPYWLYLHDTLGRWTITGRGVAAPGVLAGVRSNSPVSGGSGPAATIERMLWAGDATDYLQRLYSLDPSGTRLASDYWGVPARPVTLVAVPAADQMRDAQRYPSNELDTARRVERRSVTGPEGSAAIHRQAPGTGAIQPAPPRPVLYGRALAQIVPWFTWPFIILALVGNPRRQRARTSAAMSELLVVVPLVCTSVAIAALVAIDPRTQLFLLPMLAFHIAYGARIVGIWAHRLGRLAGVRPALTLRGPALILLVLLFGTQARWLYMSLAVGSPHHLVGAENRRIGEALGEALPAGDPVMSWHPAIALFAGRDWRVLPHAGFGDVMRYASATGAPHIVLSAYYPSPLAIEDVPGRHLVLHAAPAPAGTGGWRLRSTDALPGYTTATVEPEFP